MSEKVETSMSRKMRRVIIAVVAVFLIATAIIVPIEKSKNSEAVRLEAYQQAVSLLKAQEYWDAYDAFYYIKGYRNSDALYEYSFSRGAFAYNNRDNYDDIEGALYNIPNDYDGEFSSEISEFKVKFEAIYTAYLLNEAKSEISPAVVEQNDSASTFTPTHSGSSSNSSTNADEYNASDYSHPDDFYYDNPDDFYDYEEAEDYWDENS